MRLLLVCLFCFGLFSAEKCNKSPNYAVDIVLTKTEAYCGGIEPPDELLVELKTPKPFVGGTVYVLNDLKACVDSIPASSPEYHLALPKGAYTAHLVPQLADLDTIQSEDNQCLIAFKQRIMSMFEIEGDTAMTLNLFFGCNPCYPPPP